jgi:4a-hydroxytetrahydrobiopterin dehydratase
MNDLKTEKCVPCHGGEPAATEAEIEAFRPQIPNWCPYEVNGEKRLERLYLFADFKSALAFTNALGDLAEQQEHHPAILTEWGKVTVTWWTHAIGGLHRNDLIMALQTDVLAQQSGAK